ncbi:hypothetical protein V8F20_008113 [Naviculisporaceae sp. PSN 640]
MSYRELHVPTSPRLLVAWLWPNRFGVPTPEKSNSFDPTTNLKNPQPRVDSYNSTVSTDSYLSGFRSDDPIDVKFRQLCQNVLILDTGRDILQERKMLSHQAKKRKRRVIMTTNWRRGHQKNAAASVVKWTPIMKKDYEIYKAKVEAITNARMQAETARLLAEDSINRGEDITLREMKLCHAMDYQQVWFDAAIEAAKGRIEFMHKYTPLPCYTPKGDKGHIQAAESNLESAKDALRALEMQREAGGNEEL